MKWNKGGVKKMKRMKEGQNWSKGGYKKQKEMNVV